MKICLAQIKSKKGDIVSNITNHLKWINIAISKKADFIVFPELSLTGFEPELAKELATNQNDTRLDKFQQISNLNNISIGVGLPTQSKYGIHISMIVFQPNKARQTYSKQKLHPDELPYFIEGNKQLILKIKNTKIALAICYESFQKEHIENACKQEATLYIVSVAKPKKGTDKAFAYYPKIAKKHTISVLMVNCIGFCDNFNSVGQSTIWNNKGNLVNKLNNKDEGILIFDINL